MNVLNTVIETDDVEFDTETGSLIRGKCMSLEKWGIFLKEKSTNCLGTRLSLETRDTTSLLLVKHYLVKPWQADAIADLLWRESIPKRVYEDLIYEIGRAGLDCADNFRFYRVIDGLLKTDFLITNEKGCCGYWEGSTIDENGDKWIIGCNHGH